MAAYYKFGRLTAQWPGRARPANYSPKKAPFKGRAWNAIERKLETELAHLKAKEVTISLDLDFGSFRSDGGIYADARPRTPKVIVAFLDGRNAVRRQFPCDTYAFWQDNVWAIVLTLEALRAIDRYGVTQGDQQYVGFAQLASGTNELTPERAAEIIAKHAGVEADAVLGFPSVATMAVRIARSKAHPDKGGSDAAFAEVEQSIRALEKQHGVSL